MADKRDPAAPSEPQGVQSVEIAGEILAALLALGGSATLSEIAAQRRRIGSLSRSRGARAPVSVAALLYALGARPAMAPGSRLALLRRLGYAGADVVEQRPRPAR